MWKIDARRWVLIFLLLLARSASAAPCADIWPAATTPNSSVAPTLPPFTGSTALTLPQTLGAGDFHYAGASLNGGTLTATAASTRLYINGSLALSGNVQLNSAANPQNLILIVNGSLTLANNARIYGLVYATGSITMSGSSSITGATTAAGGIALSGGASAIYDENAVVNAGYGSLCTPPVRPALKMGNPLCGITNKILLSFDRTGGRLPLSFSSATTLSNYSLVSETGTTHVISAIRLSDDGYDVQLTFTPSLTNGRDYTVTASNVKDHGGITMMPGSDSFYFSTTSNGSIGNYWSGTTFSGNPSRQQVDSNINFSWNNTTWPAGSNSTGMSARWEGYLEVPTSGNYQFQAYSEDGSRIWLDDLASGTSIIDRWLNNAGTASSGTIALTAGTRYPLKTEMYKTPENSTKAMQLRWTTPGNSTFTAIPNANLYTCVNSFVSNSGLVAHYQLEGPTWSGAAGEVLDYSGNNLHGTTVRTSAAQPFPTAAPARVCNGAFLNGNNYIRIPDGPLMDLTDAMSITAWIRLTAVGTELKSIFSKDENYEFHITNTRQVYWWWNNSSGTARTIYTPTNSINLNTWHHIGVVYSPTRQSIYIDGVERGFATNLNEIIRTNNDPMEIGADQGLNQRIWNGALDEIKLYDRPLSAAEIIADRNATHPCLIDVGSFEVTVAATASVCTPVPVTIRAVQANSSATYTGFTGTVNISTTSNHGNWSRSGTANGTLNPASDTDDNGSVQYTFAAADNGQAVLLLSNAHADLLRISVIESGGSAIGTSGNVQFSENALVISTVPDTNTDFIAGRNHPLQIEALRRDPVTGSCGRFTAYNGNIGLKAWITPTASDANGVRPFITTTSGNVQLPRPSQPASNNATLNFNQGLASLSWITSDVGQYIFNVRDDSSGLVVDVNGAPLPIVGSSAAFTVRPFGFYTRAQNRRSPIANNPAASSATGPLFVKAGESFDVLATAVQYQAADDGNSDGQPDSGADLGNNAATPAFGQEPASVRDSVTLSNSALVLPTDAGSQNPPLTGSTVISTFSAGQGSATVAYDEVGIISLQAALTDANYLGSSNVTGSISNVGRFYPDRFTITDNAPTLRDGNGGWNCAFTYQGQPFGFDTEPQITLTAVNTSGGTTVNYTDAFWKLATPQHDIELDASGVPAGSRCLSGGVVTNACFTDDAASVARTLTGTTSYDGAATFVTGTHTLQVNKLNARPDSGDVPYSPNVNYILPSAQLTDSDGVCYSAGAACVDYRIDNITGTELRYGRGWIDNTNGPVLTPLIMTLRLQYWDAASNFVYNTLDNGGCTGTQILTTDIQLDNFTGNLQSGETAASTLSPQPGYYLMSLAAPGFDASGQPNAGTALVTWLLDNDISDNAPGETCTNHWLCYDYNGDGLNENPGARAIFSTLPDRRPLLFMRETYR